MTSYYQSDDGLRLAYEIKGNKDGLPVLCLAGVSRNSSDFDYLAQSTNEFALICPDYRGRGLSEWDENHANYTALVEARDILKLLDILAIDSIPVIGTSRGGFVAVFMANLAPKKVAGIIFNDVGPVVENASLLRILEYIGRNPSAKTFSEAAENLEKYSVGFTDVPQNRWLDEAHKHYIKTSDGLKINYDPKLFIGIKELLEAKNEVDFWPIFNVLQTMPFGLIRGSNSDLLSPATANKMQKSFPHGIFTEVPGRGHPPFLDEKEGLDLIYTFLKPYLVQQTNQDLTS